MLYYQPGNKYKNPDVAITLARFLIGKNAVFLQPNRQAVLSPRPPWQGGKSGQHRVPYFLTGRLSRNPGGTASATENNRPASNGVRVKTWGKSPRVVVVTRQRGKPYGLQGQICRRSARGG